SFGTVRKAIETSDVIAVIRDRVNGFEASTYPALLGRVAVAAPRTAPKPTERDGGQSSVKEPPPPTYVAASTLHVTYAKAFLANEDDVDAYLATLRARLVAEIQAGRRISV